MAWTLGVGILGGTPGGWRPGLPSRKEQVATGVPVTGIVIL